MSLCKEAIALLCEAVQGEIILYFESLLLFCIFDIFSIFCVLKNTLYSAYFAYFFAFLRKSVWFLDL